MLKTPLLTAFAMPQYAPFFSAGFALVGAIALGACDRIHGKWLTAAGTPHHASVPGTPCLSRPPCPAGRRTTA
ncbi:hypothetical protein ADK70_22610 [Streptomyces rimosus subsp. pseudoverticillatus]|uniref:hypothetical protein n=1 Tax=Streptomyces rimosus TaxID=1927 RepID=UPI0006B2678C|nr:hypothetical protein [Streptomyces rimosus]KOT84726.1 hypothetical protein ADK70_22610 [Streptomyces rimosus subsp. pseudoverticillatus]